VTFAVEVHPPDEWSSSAAEHIARALPRSGSLVLTGGSSATAVYPKLAVSGPTWPAIEVYFGDERCVSPDDPQSNYRLAADTLLGRVQPASVHRMRGEDDPDTAAGAYEAVVAPEIAEGFDVLLMGVGAEGHVAGLFPGSDALNERLRLCRAVSRPDGLQGLTLTPPALLSAKTVLLLVAGSSKADAVRRAVTGDEDPATCPVRLFADHPNARFVLDEAAAALL
jgi:6-phosphogluconolactonase